MDWQTLLKLLDQEALPGWYRRSGDHENVVWEVRGQIMQAAATVLIIVDDKQRSCFKVYMLFAVNYLLC